MVCIWKGFFSWRHLWSDLGLEVENTPLIFKRPLGRSKIRYCERCGKLKLVGINE